MFFRKKFSSQDILEIFQSIEKLVDEPVTLKEAIDRDKSLMKHAKLIRQLITSRRYTYSINDSTLNKIYKLYIKIIERLLTNETLRGITRFGPFLGIEIFIEECIDDFRYPYFKILKVLSVKDYCKMLNWLGRTSEELCKKEINSKDLLKLGNIIQQLFRISFERPEENDKQLREEARKILKNTTCLLEKEQGKLFADYSVYRYHYSAYQTYRDAPTSAKFQYILFLESLLRRIEVDCNRLYEEEMVYE